MITIGVTTYNRLYLLKTMAASLYQSDISVPHNVRLYDDCSTEYSAEDLKKLFPTAVSIKVNKINMKADENIIEMYKDFLKTDDDYFFNADSDLIFSKNWLTRALELIERTSGVLTLLNANLHGSYKDIDEDLCLKKTIGSAGTLFKRNRIEELINFMNPDKNKKSFDWQFSQFFVEMSVPIYCVKNSLVQHIGYTGQNSHFFFDYGRNFAIESLAQGQIINDILENYIDQIGRLEKKRIDDTFYHLKRFIIIIFKKLLPTRLYHSIRHKLKKD